MARSNTTLPLLNRRLGFSRNAIAAALVAPAAICVSRLQPGWWTLAVAAHAVCAVSAGAVATGATARNALLMFCWATSLGLAVVATGVGVAVPADAPASLSVASARMPVPNVAAVVDGLLPLHMAAWLTLAVPALRQAPALSDRNVLRVERWLLLVAPVTVTLVVADFVARSSAAQPAAPTPTPSLVFGTVWSFGLGWYYAAFGRHVNFRSFLDAGGGSGAGCSGSPERLQAEGSGGGGGSPVARVSLVAHALEEGRGVDLAATEPLPQLGPALIRGGKGGGVTAPRTHTVVPSRPSAHRARGGGAGGGGNDDDDDDECGGQGTLRHWEALVMPQGLARAYAAAFVTLPAAATLLLLLPPPPAAPSAQPPLATASTAVAAVAMVATAALVVLLGTPRKRPRQWVMPTTQRGAGGSDRGAAGGRRGRSPSTPLPPLWFFAEHRFSAEARPASLISTAAATMHALREAPCQTRAVALVVGALSAGSVTAALLLLADSASGPGDAAARGGGGGIGAGEPPTAAVSDALGVWVGSVVCYVCVTALFAGAAAGAASPPLPREGWRWAAAAAAAAAPSVRAAALAAACVLYVPAIAAADGALAVPRGDGAARLLAALHVGLACGATLWRAALSRSWGWRRHAALLRSAGELALPLTARGSRGGGGPGAATRPGVGTWVMLGTAATTLALCLAARRLLVVYAPRGTEAAVGDGVSGRGGGPGLLSPVAVAATADAQLRDALFWCAVLCAVSADAVLARCGGCCRRRCRTASAPPGNGARRGGGPRGGGRRRRGGSPGGGHGARRRQRGATPRARVGTVGVGAAGDKTPRGWFAAAAGVGGAALAWLAALWVADAATARAHLLSLAAALRAADESPAAGADDTATAAASSAQGGVTAVLQFFVTGAELPPVASLTHVAGLLFAAAVGMALMPPLVALLRSGDDDGSTSTIGKAAATASSTATWGRGGGGGRGGSWPRKAAKPRDELSSEGGRWLALLTFVAAGLALAVWQALLAPTRVGPARPLTEWDAAAAVAAAAAAATPDGGGVGVSPSALHDHHHHHGDLWWHYFHSTAAASGGGVDVAARHITADAREAQRLFLAMRRLALAHRSFVQSAATAAPTNGDDGGGSGGGGGDDDGASGERWSWWDSVLRATAATALLASAVREAWLVHFWVRTPATGSTVAAPRLGAAVVMSALAGGNNDDSVGGADSNGASFLGAWLVPGPLLVVLVTSTGPTAEAGVGTAPDGAQGVPAMALLAAAVIAWVRWGPPLLPAASPQGVRGGWRGSQRHERYGYQALSSAGAVMRSRDKQE